MSSYFSLPSFARAKQNKEQLEKTNPKNPVLNDEDEKFLNKQIESGEAPEGAKDAAPTKITESGEEKEATKEAVDQAAATSPDQVAVPEEQPEAGDGVQESKQEEPKVDSTKEEEPKQDEPQAEAGQQEEPKAEKGEAEEPKIEEPKAEEAKGEPAKPEDDPQENADDPPEQTPDESTGKAEAPIAKAKKEKKNKSLDLPSQEEAEAATKGFNAGGDKPDKPQAEQGEKRTWASYLPSVGSGAKKDQSADEKPAEAPKEGETAEQAEKRTWAQYASSAYSALPSIPSLPSTWKSKDGKAEPVYNEDGTVNEEKTKEKQEQEVSVLLDNLNMSSINNRVFAFSGETQKIYERFAQVLKDTMNGGPTAYEDMEKLMKDAGPELEKQFKSMPPFVQTLVKSLPAKLGTTLGPELLAAASEKPGGDMQARMAAASKKPSGGDPSIQTASSSSAPTAETTDKDGKKQKRKIPGLKGLVSQQGAVASILRNVVNFLTTRFPFLASATNVVMSLAVFILMFVFWYCHKRGKEARLAKELEAGKEGKVAEEAADEEVELNPWKTRFALNYKGLPYRTQWTEYPDIKPTLEPHIAANKEGFAYSSPTIRLPDGTYVMDSRQIANKLESLYPSPPLHLDSPALLKLESIMPELMPTLSGVYIPLVPQRLLNEASHPHWYKTREAKFGMPLSKLAETKGGDVAYNGARPYLEQVTTMLKEDSSGPFFLGHEVSYADFVWAGFLIFFQRIGDDVFQKVLETSGDRDAHLALLVGVKKWSARNDR